MKRAKRGRHEVPAPSRRPQKRATLAAAVGQPVRRTRQEWKYLDTGLASHNVVSSTTWTGCEADPIGAVNTLSAPVQGSGPSNRDGQEIMARSIAVDGSVVQADTAVASSSSRYVYIALVLSPVPTACS